MPPTQLQGKPSASLATLRSIDAGLAERLTKATDRAISIATLHRDIHSGNALDGMLALINMLLRLGLHVKGGAVRDYVVRGLVPPSRSDIDLEYPSHALTQSNWPRMAAGWRAQLTENLGLSTTAPVLRRGGDMLIFDITDFPGTEKVELEIVLPWNTRYLPVRHMDFSCNNLRLEPGAPVGEVRQSCAILMTVEEIVGQLLNHPKPLAIPTRDFTWRQGGPDSASPPAGVRGGNRVTLWHGTSVAAAEAIVKHGFKASDGGNLGAGVYMSQDMTFVKAQAKKHGKHTAFVCAQVDTGNVITMPGFDRSGSWRNRGYDTAYLPQGQSPRGLEQWCIADPSRIHNCRRVVV